MQSRFKGRLDEVIMIGNSAIDPIVAFYLGKSINNSGRRIEDIWKWDSKELEGIHDYIQWLFPLCEKSIFNPEAPTISIETIDAFRKNDELKRRLIISLEVMLKFYGLKMMFFEDGSIKILCASDFNTRSQKWITPGNHNFLRITRILKSLKILGLSHLADAFFACLKEIYYEHSNKIGAETFAYWNAA